METFSALLALCAGNSPVTGEFPAQRPVTRSFDVFFDLRLNRRLSKQPWGWWFETPSCSLWRHCNAKPQQQQEQHSSFLLLLLLLLLPGSNSSGKLISRKSEPWVKYLKTLAQYAMGMPSTPFTNCLRSYRVYSIRYVSCVVVLCFVVVISSVMNWCTPYMNIITGACASRPLGQSWDWPRANEVTHWSRVTHLCVGELCQH